MKSLDSGDLGFGPMKEVERPAEEVKAREELRQASDFVGAIESMLIDAQVPGGGVLRWKLDQMNTADYTGHIADHLRVVAKFIAENYSGEDSSTITKLAEDFSVARTEIDQELTQHVQSAGDEFAPKETVEKINGLVSRLRKNMVLMKFKDGVL